MRIFADRLKEQLEKRLVGTYLLFGNEPLLIQESRASIQHYAQAQGFEERHRFTVDAQLNWNSVFDCCQALSLFSSKQVIELEIGESGPGTNGAKELVSLAQQLHSDVILVLIGSKLTKAQENSQWFKSLSAQGCWVNCLSPDIQRLPQFVKMRCQALGLKPDQEAIQMLAQWHEGNLLALVQSLEKLALIYPDGQLTLVRLEAALSRHNHFTVFHWVDALLSGQANRAQRIVRQLEAEGVEVIVLLRSLQKELLLLTTMKAQMLTMPLTRVFDQHRIWQSKRPLYSSALNRLTSQALQHCIHTLAIAEQQAKTQYEQSPWPWIHQLSVLLCLPDAKLNLPA